jgi:23S rRNA (pseudouridine1915-N3)-methyltransferase
MYRFRVVRVSGGKKGPLEEMSDSFLTRLKLYAKIEVIEVKETPFKDESDRARVLSDEAKRIRLHLIGTTILLGEHGKTFDSRAFAKKLDDWAVQGAEPVTFIIGGPLGYDRALEKEVTAVLSLSPLTFPHDIAHVLLLEQIYRACTINAGKTYHY